MKKYITNILWPAFEFIKENFGIINEVEQIHELLTFAYKNFQKYLSDPNIVEHYNSLIELKYYVRHSNFFLLMSTKKNLKITLRK